MLLARIWSMFPRGLTERPACSRNQEPLVKIDNISLQALFVGAAVLLPHLWQAPRLKRKRSADAASSEAIEAARGKRGRHG